MRLLKLIRNEDSIEIRQNALGVFIEEKEVMNEIRNIVSIEVNNYEIGDIIEDVVVDKLPNLEQAVEKVLSENILVFVSEDISQEFIQDVLKEALIEKLKDYSIEDILKLLQSK